MANARKARDYQERRLVRRRIIAKTANYTITNNDNGAIFTNRGATGAVNFTLPDATLNDGLEIIIIVVADQNVTVTAAPADTLNIYNDNAADTVALSTAGERIGAAFHLYSDGVGWLCLPHVWKSIAAGTQTVTTAT